MDRLCIYGAGPNHNISAHRSTIVVAASLDTSFVRLPASSSSSSAADLLHFHCNTGGLDLKLSA